MTEPSASAPARGVQRLFSIVLTDDDQTSPRWRRYTTDEVADHLAAPGVPAAALRRHLADARSGRSATIPAELAALVTDFFGVPADFLTDPRIAGRVTESLLAAAFTQLSISAAMLCRVHPADADEQVDLLCAVLDSALSHR